MKLRYYLVFAITEAMAAWTIASSMWLFTQKDLFEIIVVTFMFSPAVAVTILALTVDEDPIDEEPEEDLEEERRFQIYTLEEEEYHGKRIS